MKQESRAPLVFAIVLLLLPVAYLGSYLALVEPGRYWFKSIGSERVYVYGYRYFGECSGIGAPPAATRVAPLVYWPIEQIDRVLRPDVWSE